MASKDIEKAEPGRFPALLGGDNAILDIVRENIGDGDLDVFDLDRIGIPGGGGSSWEVPSLEGTDTVKELEGVIVAWRSPRVFWIESVDDSGGGQPPDCSSDNGVIGRGMFGPDSPGNPSGRCEHCPMSQWGSADNGKGKGKACRETRQLFMLLPGAVLPISVGLPPTSIKPLKQYMLRLASEGVYYYSVSTKLALEPKSDGGRRWSEVRPSLGQRLTEEETQAAKALGDQLRKAMERPVPQPAAAPADAE